MHRIKFLFILTVSIFSCTGEGDSFYSSYADGDLYRMPVLEPYQLTHLYGMEEGEGSDLWELRFSYGGDKETPGFNDIGNPGYNPGVAVKEINVSNGIIYGHNKKINYGTDVNGKLLIYPDVWFVIIPREKIEKVFKDRETEWKAFLKEKGIIDIQMHGVWNLFRKYRDTYTLPWYDPNRNILPK
jgi:hypothetical protein